MLESHSAKEIHWSAQREFQLYYSISKTYAAQSSQGLHSQVDEHCTPRFGGRMRMYSSLSLGAFVCEPSGKAPRLIEKQIDRICDLASPEKRFGGVPSSGTPLQANPRWQARGTGDISLQEL